MDNNMEMLDDFGKWKEFLGAQVDRAQAMGMSEDQIANVAQHIGDWLANKVDPKNPQQRLLKQMWDVADESEQTAMARIMVRLTDRTH